MKTFENAKVQAKYHDEKLNTVMMSVHPTFPSDMKEGWADFIDWETPEAKENFLRQLSSDAQYSVDFLVDKSTGDVELAQVAIYPN